jgi:phosphatidylserine/phosphatidylglycerophosphate/cardiolipin synthase-like enzyme
MRFRSLVLLLVACGGPSDNPDGGDIPADAGMLPDDAIALLEVHALDLWAQPLDEAESTLAITRDGAAVEVDAWPVVAIPLTEAASFGVELSSEAHEAAAIEVAFDGSGVEVTGASSGTGLSVSHEERTIAGRTIPVHTVYLGLRHLWFSAEGRPPRRGNDIELMTSGEEAWGRVAGDLRGATDSVHMSTWWWESSFELERDPFTHVTSTIEDREANTVLAVLDAISATKRILVGQFISQDGSLDWVTVDAPLRDRGAAAGDSFEFMGQANETRGMFTFEIPPFEYQERLLASFPAFADRTFDPEPSIESTLPSRDVDLTMWPVSIDVPVASYHQKFAIIDGRIAFVGGMNLRRVDWDTDDHLVFEPRRMLIDSSTEDRMAVEAREALPDNGPRKDYMTRIEGPLVQDVEEVFQIRWQNQLDTAAMYSENATEYEVVRDHQSFPDGVQAQLTATLPEPFWEHAIAETWLNAIENAEEYIYIEDQYFRIPMLLDAIIERMTAVPTLQLVVITKPVDEFTDPGCEWTYRTTQQLLSMFPTRYHLFQLRAFDIQETFGIDETEERFTDIDVHSKLLIVDDVFLSVGSANKNNRGIVYEGELNVAVFDRAWVTAARRRALELILPPGEAPEDDAAGWITQLEEMAIRNQIVWDNWDAEGGDISLDGDPLPSEYSPSGLVYPLVFRSPDECLIEGVGPDMT